MPHELDTFIEPNTAMRTDESHIEETEIMDCWEVKLWIRAHSRFFQQASEVYGNTVFTTAWPKYNQEAIGADVVDVSLIDFTLWLIRDKGVTMNLTREDIQYTITDRKKERGDFEYAN